MDATAHLDWLRREGALLSALPVQGLGAAVAACPGWSVERLVGHVGRVHRWAASFLRQGPQGGEPDAGPRPPRGEAVLSWYADCLADLLEELARHDPDEPSLAFVGPAPAGFWFRRQAHETAIHRWDAYHAIMPGAEAPLDAAQALDGIDEWLQVFVPRRLALDHPKVPAPLVGATLHLHVTDDPPSSRPGEWTLRLTEDGGIVELGHAKGDAAIRGSAAALLLRVWHRPGGPPVETFGEADLARRMLDLIRVS